MGSSIPLSSSNVCAWNVLQLCTAMYQGTGEVEYLQKAKLFCNFICDYGKHGCRTPDRPFSLFEGMSGTVYFLNDMEKILENSEDNIKLACFPCFYVLG